MKLPLSGFRTLNPLLGTLVNDLTNVYCKIRAADLDFVPFCENEFPPGSVAKRWGAVASLQGLDVVRYTALELTPPLVRAGLEHLPGKITQTGVNALVIDSVYRLQTVPIHLRLPYVQIWNVLHFERINS